MGKSANPAKAAEQRKISQVGDFKKRLGGIQELPSGLVVKLKNPGGLNAFISEGILPNALMEPIQTALAKGKKPTEQQVMGALAKDGKIDKDTLADMMSMIDAVALKTIVEPKIFPIGQAEIDEWNSTREPDAADWATTIEDVRQDDRLYIDELPADDKQFIFQWVTGGTRDLVKFRQQADASLDAVVASAVATNTAIEDPGAN